MIRRPPRYFGAVAVVSLCFGLLIGWFIWGQRSDVPDRVIAMLDEICQPFVVDGDIETTSLFQLRGHHGKFDYADEATALSVSLSADQDQRRCTISDMLQPHPLEDWAEAYDQTQLVWSTRLTFLNGEVPVFLDLSHEGVGEPHILIRPRAASGYYLMFIKFNHDPRTQMTLGYSTFNRTVAKEEAL